MVHSRRNRPRYAPNTGKAVEVILWLANRQPGIDIYHLVKAAFFADKLHVAEYGRPIVGDDYEARPYGPLPRVIYGLLRHEPLEILAAGVNGPLPFEIRDTFVVHAIREPNLRRLSESDQEALQHGLEIVRDKSFDELVDMTHDDPAYLNADGGMLDYRDFIPEDDPERDTKAADLCETARYSVF
jgi:uncharacterized phage-associated protein